jgi:hypothetical protein
VRVEAFTVERRQDCKQLLFGTTTNLKKIPLGSDVMQAGSSVIKPADVVRDLGVMLDAQLSTRGHDLRQHKPASSICVDCIRFVSNSAMT